MTVCLMHADQAYGFVTALDGSGSAVSMNNVAYSAGKQSNTPQGTGGCPTGSNPMYTLASNGAITSPNYSLFAVGTCGSASVTQSAIDMDNSSERYFQFRVANGKVEFLPFNSAMSALLGNVTASSALTVTELSRGFTMGATAMPGRTACFQNGVMATATYSSGTMKTPGIGIPISVGARVTSAQQWSTGALMLVAVWRRTLADSEMVSLADNPWQLFRPRFRRTSAFSPSTETSAAWLDAITAADLTSATYFSAAQVADILSAAESGSAAATNTAAAADTLTLGDAVSSALSALAAASDSLSASEAFASLQQAVSALVDTLALNDSASSSAAGTATRTDSLSLSDSTTSAAQAAAAYIDSLGLIDQAVAAGSASATRADSVTVTDATSSLLTAIASASDSLAATDVLAAFLAGAIPPVTIDKASITKAHWVTFAGGTHVVSFAGGTKVVVFGGGTRVVTFGGSGVKKVVFDGGAKRVAFAGGTKRVTFDGSVKRVVFGGSIKTVVF